MQNSRENDASLSASEKPQVGENQGLQSASDEAQNASQSTKEEESFETSQSFETSRDEASPDNALVIETNSSDEEAEVVEELEASRDELGAEETSETSDSENESVEISELTEEDLAELEATRERLLENAAIIEDHLVSLSAWTREREKSYAWNLAEKLKQERAAVEVDRERAERLLNSIRIPTVEALKFVSDKALHRLKLASLVWLAASIGLWLLKEAATRAAQGVLGDNAIINLVIASVADWLSGDYMTYALLFFLVSFVLALIGSFVAHYRDWSNVARALDRAHSAFDYSSRLEVHTRVESQRLANLHRHTMRVLRVLAKMLRNPYKLPTGVDIDPSVDIDDKTLPLSVRFGVAKTGNRAQHLRLRRQVMRRMVRKSWRSNSYLLFVNKIGEELGYDQEEFNVETMDRALSGDSDGLIAPFEMSLSDFAALESVGSDHFETLSDYVREEIVPKIGLPIRLLHEKPLTQVFPEDQGDSVAIEEFLGEAFNDEAVERTPTISLQTLNEVSRTKRTITRENTITVALVPEDFRLEETGDEKRFILSRLTSTGAGGVDLTVRTDIAGPVEKDNFTVFSSGLRDSTSGLRRDDINDVDGEL